MFPFTKGMKINILLFWFNLSNVFHVMRESSYHRLVGIIKQAYYKIHEEYRFDCVNKLTLPKTYQCTRLRSILLNH